ncbi:MAG: LysM peptidoglycan-binding domain-containing protein [Chloroflexi bacterium]|nr:LysM peptidoglycan-binding domain-containing protein [Chloroflexota bacterium]
MIARLRFNKRILGFASLILLPVAGVFLVLLAGQLADSPPFDSPPSDSQFSDSPSAVSQPTATADPLAEELILPDDNLQGGADDAPSSGPSYLEYRVRSGDTLAAIANRYSVSVAALMAANGIRNPNLITIGQLLRVPLPSAPTPLPQPSAARLIPDSEAVYSPAYAHFDVSDFAQKHKGYLAGYQEKVDGEWLTGPQIIQLVAERFSVGPRVLLALLEMQGSWVTQGSASATRLNYPLGLINANRKGLYKQVWWAAEYLNEGYYGQLLGRSQAALVFSNGYQRKLPAGLNPGTAAVYNMLARTTTYANWLNLIGPGGFRATYRALFGDPFAKAVEPLVPPNLTSPELALPWSPGEMWYLTGGPHGAWASGSAWAAIDFAPAGQPGCRVSTAWAVAAAPGQVVQAEQGRVMVNLSGQDFQGAGWTLMYMHMAAQGRVAVGAQVETGDPIGHPSCEGGYATGLHLHLARLYNGQWMSVASEPPFVLSGWVVHNALQEYDGSMTLGSEKRSAINGKVPALNGILIPRPLSIDQPALFADSEQVSWGERESFHH